MQPTPHPKLFCAYHRPYSLGEVERMIAEVASLVHGSPDALRLKIKELVAEYAECSDGLPGVAADKAPGVRLPQRSTKESRPLAES
jgi:hypothetical protein